MTIAPIDDALSARTHNYLAPLVDLRTWSCSQMQLCCRQLARGGHSDHEIAEFIGWHVTEVRRALSREGCA